MSAFSEALDKLTEADLQGIDLEITALKKKLSGLKSVRRVIRARLHGVCRKSPKRTPDPESPNGQASATDDLRRLSVAKYLRGHGGAVKLKTLSEQLGIPAGGSIYKVTSHEWFERQGDGSVKLSQAGKAGIDSHERSGAKS